ncbi:hypothetical protein CASFOL_042338 [Castilleja foliolosa]|uniref:PUM-HD domain-containing protein n=1 Tax=Castilleja foliolosa TaxID=1961234 RepID=A0ABD3BAH0_9LAMI
MDSNGRDRYFNCLPEYLLSPSPEYPPMAADNAHINGGYFQAPPTNGYLASPNHRLNNNSGYMNCLPDYLLSPSPEYPPMAADNRLINGGYFLSGNNQPPTNGYLGNNNSGLSPYDYDYLESGFKRLGLSSPNHPYQNSNSLALKLLYMDQLNNRMNGVNLNSNLNRNRPNPYDYRSEYEIGNFNPYYPKAINRRGSIKGLGSSQASSSSSSSSSLKHQIFSSLSELRGKIALAAKDQMGCRFLLKKLEEEDINDINLIFSELKDNICDLMVNQFGNYIVQKLFSLCDGEQRNQLLCLLINDERGFEDICTNSHGTRAVQKLLEHLTTPEQRTHVVQVLRRIALALINNINGQHVIVHYLKYFTSEEKKHILNIVVDNCQVIARDKSGCCVLQQCLSDGEMRDRLLPLVTSDAHRLSEDPYGNYVVQFILGLKIDHVTKAIMGRLSGNFVWLSMNKYASNVVEKILKQSEGDEALIIVKELITGDKFLRVLQDPYGNYVAQSALTASRGPVQRAMCSLVFDNYPYLHSHPHGKRVLARAKGLKLRL